MRQHHKGSHVFKAEFSDAQSIMFLELIILRVKKSSKSLPTNCRNLILTSDPWALFHICNNNEVNFPDNNSIFTFSSFLPPPLPQVLSLPSFLLLFKFWILSISAYVFYKCYITSNKKVWTGQRGSQYSQKSRAKPVHLAITTNTEFV